MLKNYIIFVTYNLYKGGSLRLLNAILTITNANPLIRIFSPWYPVKYLNNLWRVILDQLIVPFLILVSRKVVLFGNVPSLLYFGKQVVLIHNPNYWREDWRTLSIRNKFEFYYFFFCNAIAIKLKKVRYVTQIVYVENKFRKMFPNSNIRTIGSPFDSDIFESLIEGTSHVNSVIRTKNYFYYPAYFYESKNHQILSNAASRIRNDFDIDIVCSNNGGLKGLGDYCNLNDEENLCLLKNANGLIFPSEFETFGYPLIEAAFLGKPIIALNREYVKSLVGNIYLFENSLESLLETVKLYDEDCQNQCVRIPFIIIDTTPKNFVQSLILDSF